jgi:hypothetical protein
MTVRQIIQPAALSNVSHTSLLVLASFQLLEPPGGDPSTETTLLTSRSIVVVSLFMLWLVLPALIERWRRDDRKEVSTSLYDPKTGTTESRTFKGYDRKAIIELFRETARHYEAKRDIGRSHEGPKQDEEG